MDWSTLVAVITMALAVPIVAVLGGGDTKPFKGEVGLEPFLTGLAPGSFDQQLFVDPRALYGTEVWAGTIQHTSHNNVGGTGSGLVLEAVYAVPTAPTGVIVYILKYEVIAEGDKLVFGGGHSAG